MAGVRIAPPAPPDGSFTDRAERKDSMRVWRIAGVAVLVITTVVIPASAQTADIEGSVTLPAEGRFARGGEFAGKVTVNRFEQRGNSIVAIGVVTGTLRRGNRSIASVLAAEVTWPVVVRTNGVTVARSGAAAPARITPAHFRLAQAEQCPTVQIGLGPIEVSVGGANVTFAPIMFELSGDAAEPLGSLVCEVGNLIGNVAGLVGLLNDILGLITGLLGSVTGLVPVP